MAARLKVYRTRIGFHEVIVAAPNQKAALAAWDIRDNLFADGAAAVTDEPAAVEATLARPGVVMRRAVGAKAAWTPLADRGAAPRLPGGAPPARRKPPDRRRLDAAEARLSEAEAALTAERRRLQTERRAFERRQAAALARAEKAVDTARRAAKSAAAAFRRAGGRT